MKNETARLVQISFQSLLADGRLTGDQFFARLLDSAPLVARHFAGKTEMERRRMMAVFAFTIEALDDFEIMLPALRVAGVRYRDLGIGRAEYAQFGSALIATLEAELGAAWTPELRAAWAEAYGAIVSAMRSGTDEALTAA